MKKLINQTLAFSLALSTLVTSAIAASEEERWFQVELLIFKNPRLENDNPEVWPKFIELNRPSSFIQLQPTSPNDDALTPQVNELALGEVLTSKQYQYAQLTPFAKLTPNEYQLSQQATILETDPNYEVLFHEAWNEPVPDRSTVVPIKIQGGEQFGRQFELQGYINLYVERYLHFSTELNLVKYQKSRDPFSLIEDSPSNASALQTLNSFGGISLINTDTNGSNQITRESKDFYIAIESAQLKESRKMRSKRIHYLDNPRFGILILITPIELVTP